MDPVVEQVESKQEQYKELTKTVFHFSFNLHLCVTVTTTSINVVVSKRGLERLV